MLMKKFYNLFCLRYCRCLKRLESDEIISLSLGFMLHPLGIPKVPGESERLHIHSYPFNSNTVCPFTTVRSAMPLTA